ncbi:glycosyltransferase family 4 protein [Puniceicoccus vermicola]|uniref:Glycosyltransferase family 4 protein n=1 Tax=Puniceicoccus vermicola TaxID=388746 RepID=A0A7X1AW56_9BACT|nr:glycosyltransferase family 4 protein [Puniceicoccus vermicola]MBC2601105.1 glycosyltransferase family 4 protein [Puniceicoccus vermicola]
MKVVHIINRLIGGGAEVMIPQIHRQHLADGIDSWILSMESGDDRGTEKVVSFGKRYPRWQEPFRLRKVLRQMEESGSIDVVHTHLTQSQLFGKYAIRGLKKKPFLVTTEHDTSNRRRHIPGGRVFDRFLYEGYDRIICISEGVRDSMEEWLPKTRSLLRVASNGVDVDAFMRGEVERRDGPLRFLSVGRLTEKKNFTTAIRALAAVEPADWTYTLVGDGEQRPELESLVDRLGVRENVHFAGYVSDVSSFYAKSDVFLFPSLWEGFGLVAVEAMAAGLPVLASDVPGLSEVIARDGVSGILLPSTEVDQWAGAIRKCLSDRDLTLRMGKGARERSRNYSIQKTADRYREVYAEMCR